MVNAPSDQTRHFRQPASNGLDQYLIPQNLPGFTVGLARRPLTLQRTPAFLVLVQAGNSNGGIVYIGGANVDIANGIELIAGTANLFATAPNMQQRQLSGALSFGTMRTTQDISGRPSGAAGRMDSFLLFDMRDIWVVADAIDQAVKVMFMLPQR